MRKTFRVFLYFSCWILVGLICVVLNIINIDWTRTNVVNGIVIVVVLGILQGSVLEFPVQTIATLLIGGEKRETKRAPCDRLTCLLNYNLLATSKDDILECIETMYMAYVGNLSPNIAAVLVSATGDEELKEYELQIRDTYRAILYDDLYREGLAFAKADYEMVDPIHLKNVWSVYVGIDKDVFVNEYLEDVCDRYARDFMVVHRVSRVLRKCGQYQDLMLLSEGDFEAFSYCDPEYYGRSARQVGEPLFHSCEDVSNILERKFDYTLVLDADTGVPRGGVFDMLQIAAAYPERGIIQPSIKLNCSNDDTIFMNLESMRQSIYEPMTNAITALFAQSSYFGKALIKNRLYIDSVIGSKQKLIERVPVDVLSHDTFEAALLKPLYAGSTYLLEAPSHNYVTWNIRERRWNRGEILLAMYFWKNAFGKPMRWIQRQLQKSKFNKTKVRTESKLDFVTSYIAHSALRQMIMKPALLLYIILHISVHLRYRYASIIIVMFSVLVFPKFATCNRENYKYVFLETVASIVQFTPEALVGTVRIARAVYANISLNVKWIPQRAVEEEFKSSNPFLSSIKHLWGYSLFSVISGVLVILFLERAMLVLVMLVTLMILPIYTGFTSLPLNFRFCQRRKQTLSDIYKDSLRSQELDKGNGDLKTISSVDTYKSLGKLSQGKDFYDFSQGKTDSFGSNLSHLDDLIDATYDFGNTGSVHNSPGSERALSYLNIENFDTKWPSKVTNRRPDTLRSTAYTEYDYVNKGKNNGNKYVSIVNVGRPDMNNSEISEEQAVSTESNRINLYRSNAGNKNITNIYIENDTLEDTISTSSSNYEYLEIRRNLTGKTSFYIGSRERKLSNDDGEQQERTSSGSGSDKSSVERLYENIDVLKEFRMTF